MTCMTILDSNYALATLFEKKNNYFSGKGYL